MHILNELSEVLFSLTKEAINPQVDGNCNGGQMPRMEGGLVDHEVLHTHRYQLQLEAGHVLLFQVANYEPFGSRR